MKYFFSILLAFFSVGSSYADSPVASEYVSIDCPQGDITLVLGKDGKFSLELKRWEENRHTGSETLSGRWKLTGKQLTLLFSSEVNYEREQIPMTVGVLSDTIDGFKWRHSSNSTFADTFLLVERKSADALFHRAIAK